MCPDCHARQALNDRLLRLLEERERFWAEWFLKHTMRKSERQRLGRRKPMMRRLGLSVAVLLGMLVPGAAEAVGPVVGASCTISWNAVTTNTDGSLITLPVTYELYVAPGLPTTVGIPPVLTSAGLSVPDCSGLANGQYTAFLVAVAGGIKSSLSAPLPFMVQLPLVPSAPTG